ncbi:ricin-type beta-trefoil lectin domain protein [Streptomyces sp. NPDC005498]|uniref:ricin-type beta-trefoil lectin domain protein n=1 Tax=Streptomyces sp. NPDC005498 TaxID=3364717 RepID=UPI0036C083DB
MGAVGLLSAGCVLLTLVLANQDKDGKSDRVSVPVIAETYDSGVLDELGGPPEPSASASGPRRAKATGSRAKATPSASSERGASGTASASPGAESAASADDKSPTREAVAGVAVFSHASGHCIDVVGGKAAPGAKLMIWDCSGSASQHWEFTGGGMRRLDLCVQAAGGSTADGVDLELATCDGRPAQRFELNVRHDLVSRLADKCVDVRDGATDNGTRLQLWSCNGHDNQKWSAS